jgi:hypothetical protein
MTVFLSNVKEIGKYYVLPEEDTFVSFGCLMTIDISPSSQIKNTAQNYVHTIVRKKL